MVPSRWEGFKEGGVAVVVAADDDNETICDCLLVGVDVIDDLGVPRLSAKEE